MAEVFTLQWDEDDWREFLAYMGLPEDQIELHMHQCRLEFLQYERQRKLH